jgi:colanic acid/amylovoran/stewartan biosynthesis glycosyltransferase WcaL/AmsK/CpsK
MLPQTWPVWRQRYRRLFAAVDLVLAEGPAMRESIVALGCPPEKARVQRLGVETERIAFLARRPPADGVTRVLIAGAFREKKGIPLALEAVARLRDRGLSLSVTVVGGSNGSLGEEAERRRIETVVRDRGLDETVTLLGMVPFERFVAAGYEHHVFLSPSLTAADGDTEGGAPVSIIEMAAAGMPIVSSRHCDIPGVVEDGVSGLLAPEGDLEGLSERLAEVVEHPERWEAMGRAGRRLVEERFDVRACCASLRALYDETLGEGP